MSEEPKIHRQGKATNHLGFSTVLAVLFCRMVTKALIMNIMYQPLDQATCEHRLIRWYFQEKPTENKYRCDYGVCRHCISRIPSPPVVLPQRVKNGLLARGLIRNRERNMARYKFTVAKRAGKITRKPCEVCGDLKSEAHHPDYSKPLDVVWLCKPHHVKADAYRRMAEKIQRLERLLGLEGKA